MLVDWGGARVFKDAEKLVANGRVLSAAYEPPSVKGSILFHNRPFQTSMRILPDGVVENQCSCRDNTERFMICSHVIALGLTLVKRAGDPHREARHRAEQRRAARIAAIDESEYIQRVLPGRARAEAATVRVTLAEDWAAGIGSDRIPVTIRLAWGEKAALLEDVPRTETFAVTKQDDNLLYVLEDLSEGPPSGAMRLSCAEFANLLRLKTGQNVFHADGTPISVNATRLETRLRMDLDRETGELILIAHTELPFLEKSEFPVHVVGEKTGWVFASDHFWPVERVLPGPYHGIYERPVIVARSDVVRFLLKELPVLADQIRVESDLSLDLFTVDPGEPVFRLVAQGSPASLSAVLYARYGQTELVAGKPDVKGDFSAPDPDDLMRYTVRNPEAERRALALASPFGLTGEVGDALSPIVGCREVLNFLGAGLPALRRRGWKVIVEGRAAPFLETMDFAVPVVRVEDSAEGWFEVGFDFEDTLGASLSHADVQRALQMGNAYMEKDGRTILIDSESVAGMRDVFSDCDSAEGGAPGRFRMAEIHAPFVKASLDVLDGVDVEAAPEWLRRVGARNRTLSVAPVAIAPPLDGVLRDYQKEGVSWLRFLEENGFGGILADEMGLGKTVQALAWLRLQRACSEATDRPALIVCPSSLVENWAEEAMKFVPDMNVVTLTGSDRTEKWAAVDTCDMAVTSYAILRRDVEQCEQHEFAAVILDEAQHIKNRATQNALAAKRVKARHKLVLTGTPMENGVSDLWSIMDFLMPGYLGAYPAFKERFEVPISHGGPESEVPQARLRRKLQPFLLRRLKREVARELPPKIEKVSTCALSADQLLVYREILASSRTRIHDMVSKRGFNKSRMAILATLVRLRQACCHLDLLKLPGVTPKEPSAKTDLFFELVDEALDGGHRILVFSQFVRMLTILRAELEKRGLEYCYLDGSTKDRMSVVHRFNTEREIPLFLISLKAGGTGLNLTGADMVIHFDPWWNPAVEDQATDRAHRIGQKRTVYSHKLIARGTVEEKVLDLQRRKKVIIDATVESGESMPKNMSWNDIEELLSL